MILFEVKKNNSNNFYFFLFISILSFDKLTVIFSNWVRFCLSSWVKKTTEGQYSEDQYSGAGPILTSSGSGYQLGQF